MSVFSLLKIDMEEQNPQETAEEEDLLGWNIFNNIVLISS